MTKLKFTIVSGAVFASLVVSLALQQHSEAKLFEQDQAARQQSERLDELAVENARLSNAIAKAINPPSTTGDDAGETLRLRGEAGRLHEETRHLAELTDTLKAAGEQMSNLIAQLPPNTVTNTFLRTNVFSVATLREAGNHTLDDSIQTVLFAYSSHHPELLQKMSLTRNSSMAGRAGRSFEAVTARLQGLSAIALAEQEEYLDGSVQITCQFKYAGGAGTDSASQMRVLLRPTDHGWVMDSFPKLLYGGGWRTAAAAEPAADDTGAGRADLTRRALNRMADKI